MFQVPMFQVVFPASGLRRPSMPRLPARLWLTLAGCLLLAACSSTPMRPADEGSGSVARMPSRTTPGGGYYKDDGPGDSVPANLDQIPDAEPRVEPLRTAANRPYTVFGKTYTPMTSLEPYDKTGRASWYGRRFHGQSTSSGEPYDMYAMTAAHPTLPIPSYARVTNLENGHSVIVRVNDRGPFLSGRLIDLSYAAAYKLGYVKAGSTEVEVQSIMPDDMPAIIAAEGKPAPAATAAVAQTMPVSAPQAVSAEPLAERPLPPLTSPPSNAVAAVPAPTPPAADTNPPVPVAVATSAANGGSMAATPEPFLQLGAFSSLANAEEFKTHVTEELSWLAQRLQVVADGGRYRLHAGPYVSAAEARSAAARIAAVMDLKPFVVWR